MVFWHILGATWLGLIRLRRGGSDGKRGLQSCKPLWINPRAEPSAAGMCTIRGAQLLRLFFFHCHFLGFCMKERSWSHDIAAKECEDSSLLEDPTSYSGQ